MRTAAVLAVLDIASVILAWSLWGWRGGALVVTFGLSKIFTRRLRADADSL